MIRLGLRHHGHVGVLRVRHGHGVGVGAGEGDGGADAHGDRESERLEKSSERLTDDKENFCALSMVGNLILKVFIFPAK